jgi:hypothetical protein
MNVDCGGGVLVVGLAATVHSGAGSNARAKTVPPPPTLLFDK